MRHARIRQRRHRAIQGGAGARKAAHHDDEPRRLDRQRGKQRLGHRARDEDLGEASFAHDHPRPGPGRIGASVRPLDPNDPDDAERPRSSTSASPTFAPQEALRARQSLLEADVPTVLCWSADSLGRGHGLPLLLRRSQLAGGRRRFFARRARRDDDLAELARLLRQDATTTSRCATWPACVCTSGKTSSPISSTIRHCGKSFSRSGWSRIVCRLRRRGALSRRLARRAGSVGRGRARPVSRPQRACGRLRARRGGQAAAHPQRRPHDRDIDLPRLASTRTIRSVVRVWAEGANATRACGSSRCKRSTTPR